MTTQIKQARQSLPPYFQHHGQTQEEQIKINQEGLALLKKWQKEDEQLTQEEIMQAQKTWEMAKEILDENRSRTFFS